MNESKNRKLRQILLTTAHHSFNRSISALEKAGAIETSELHKHYSGVGSIYYDIVTEQMELTVDQLLPSLIDIHTELD